MKTLRCPPGPYVPTFPWAFGPIDRRVNNNGSRWVMVRRTRD